MAQSYRPAMSAARTIQFDLHVRLRIGLRHPLRCRILHFIGELANRDGDACPGSSQHAALQQIPR